MIRLAGEHQASNRHPISPDLAKQLAGKPAFRRDRAALPLAENLRLLDDPRERELANSWAICARSGARTTSAKKSRALPNCD